MISFALVKLNEILTLRTLYLTEMNTQIRYDACHARSWSDSYLILSQSKKIGYIAVKGLNDLSKRNTIFEVYILPAYRKQSQSIFEQFLSEFPCTHMEAQSNDLFLSHQLERLCQQIKSEVILFKFDQITDLQIPATIFRKTLSTDDVYGKKKKDIGQFVLEINGKIVADGGILLHYNKPFADLYMETCKENRKQGYGSYMIQELIKECFHQHRIPAARCSRDNVASQKTLLKAGLKVSGHMLTGTL